MLRESHLVPQKRPLSQRSSSKFFYLVDAVAKHHEPTKTQLGALESSYGATGEYLMACDEFRDLVMTVHAQGSRRSAPSSGPCTICDQMVSILIWSSVFAGPLSKNMAETKAPGG